VTDLPTPIELVAGAATETAALADLLADTHQAIAVHPVTDDLATVVTPPGATRTMVNLQPLADQPTRARGLVVVHRPDSFVDAVDRLGPTEGTVVYVDDVTQRLVAVLNDDHGADDPGWRDHRVRLEQQHTPEWTFWTSHQGLGEQQRFAEVIEDGLDEIIDPAPADLLEVAQTFQAAIQSEFRQAARLHDGAVQFVFAESIDAKAGVSGTVDVPTEFKVRLAVYRGGALVDLTARLRYRLRGGALQIGYQLVHPERAVDDAFAHAIDRILAGLADFDVVYGPAPAEASIVEVPAVSITAR